METISSHYTTLDDQRVDVSFTKEIIRSGDKVIIVLNHDDYELRLLRTTTGDEPAARNTRIEFNAQILSKKSGIIIHVPVVRIMSGDHAGAMLIGRTAQYKKHRALLSNYISADRVFDKVTVPYSDYMVMETMLREVGSANPS